MEALVDMLIFHFEKLRNEGLSPSKALSQAFLAVEFEEKASKLVSMAAVEILLKRSALEITSKPALRKWYANKVWRGQNFNLSQNIHQITTKTRAEIIATIRSRLRAASNWQSTARALAKLGVTKADIPKYINELEQSARRVLAGDRAAIKEYRHYLSKAKTNITRLNRAGNTSRLQKAYANLLKKTENISTEGLNKAMSRIAKAKIDYNAQRVARTELARAYGIGEGYAIQRDPDSKGIKWVLSSAHKIYDICNLHSGYGVYPVNRAPAYPAHPHCTCVLEKVYEESKKTERFDESGYSKQLKNASKKEKIALLGRKGAKEFIRSPRTWQRNLRNWQGTQPLLGDDKIPANLIL